MQQNKICLEEGKEEKSKLAKLQVKRIISEIMWRNTNFKNWPFGSRFEETIWRMLETDFAFNNSDGNRRGLEVQIGARDSVTTFAQSGKADTKVSCVFPPNLIPLRLNIGASPKIVKKAFFISSCRDEIVVINSASQGLKLGFNFFESAFRKYSAPKTGNDLCHHNSPVFSMH